MFRRLAIESFLCLALLVVSSCRGVSAVPEGWTREELEVVVHVDPAVIDLLGEQESAARVEQLVTEKILSLADVGLRFYPVASPSYGEADRRPEYLLTVEIRGLDAGLDRALVRTNATLADVRTEVDELSCSASATLVKRRAEGPPLLVGRAEGRGEVSVRDASSTISSSQRFMLRTDSGFLPAPSFDAQDLNASVERAVTKALRGLLDPIDREFGAF